MNNGRPESSRFHNILLDFLDRSNRELYNLYKNSYSTDTHIALLLKALNCAVFLCEDFCVCPPGPIAECHIARRVLIAREAFLDGGLIRWPLREATFEEFFAKKQREYRPFRDLYSGLYSKRMAEFFRSHPEAILSKRTRIGDALVPLWEHGPDTGTLWSPEKSLVEPAHIDHIRGIPRRLREDSLAVSWAAIEARLPQGLGTESAPFRILLQHNYFKLYFEEYSLKMLTGIPFARRVDLRFPTIDLAYDYLALQEALSTVQVWDILMCMSAHSIIRLRSCDGYFRFREVFDVVAKTSSSPRHVGQIFAQAANSARYRSDVKATSIVDGLRQTASQHSGEELGNDELEAIAHRLSSIALALSETDIGVKVNTIIAKERPRLPKTIGVFVALQMERELFAARWKLIHSPSSDVWTGALGATEIVLYSPDEMGRVPAAVQTTKFLHSHQPELILVLGIAGGVSPDVRLGDVLVPNIVADLAGRKVFQDGGHQFRPMPFKLDVRIQKLTRTFVRSEWERRSIEAAAWPDGERPTLRYGPIACVDEVVSSDDWRSKLLLAWPKLEGIEMEAGGVCKAAEDSGVPVAVIRGISDLADPRKSDNEWRRRALITVAVLLEYLFDHGPSRL